MAGLAGAKGFSGRATHIRRAAAGLGIEHHFIDEQTEDAGDPLDRVIDVEHAQRTRLAANR